MSDEWTFRSRRGGYERTTPLALYWELHCDPISDDWTPDEIGAADLMRRWVKSYFPDERGDARYGQGMVRIFWYVTTPSLTGVFECAPFQADPSVAISGDFLVHYSKPVNARTGEPVNFLRLPVVDKLWNSERCDKGGFVQEATGWKPSPLQACVHVPGLLSAAGLGSLLPYRPAHVDQPRGA